LFQRAGGIIAIAVAGLTVAGAAGCSLLMERTGEGFPALVRNENRLLRKHVDDWEDVKQRNVVMQDHEYTCGAASLATLMRYYFHDDVTEKEILDVIQRQMPEDEWVEKFTTGLSMRDLMRVARAQEFGYEAETRELKLSDLVKLTAPVLVHMKKGEFQHFVVYRGIVEDRVYLADPIRGNVRMSVDEFKEQWTGMAMALSKEGPEPGDDHALAVDKSRTSRPELQVARRALSIRP